MNTLNRRKLLQGALGMPLFGLLPSWSIASASAPRPTDIRIESIRIDYEDFLYRTPMKFHGTVVDKVTVLNVHATVRTVSGKQARGFGSMPMSNVWAFPSKTMNYDTTLGAVKALAQRIAKITGECKLSGHPIDLNWELEAEYLKVAEEVSRELALKEPLPKLCTLMVASPFDAALHDGFGMAHGLSAYKTYGPDFMSHDLGYYLGDEFKGEQLPQYIRTEPKPRMPMYHLVGAADPIVSSDIQTRVNDGLPETLPEWIKAFGLTHIKIKLNGSDLAWDVERVLRVDEAAARAQQARGCDQWVYSLDFNETCPNVQYLLEFINRIKTKVPRCFDRIQYIEQPTGRDLKASRNNVMHDASKLRPIVIDESLTDLENLKLARQMGYTGAALKACKGQSQSLLMTAAAKKYGMFMCVQDLTCPGASLIHSAGLSAHIPDAAAIESNSPHYVPAANKGWAERFPGIFATRDGMLDTGQLTGPGLGTRMT